MSKSLVLSLHQILLRGEALFEAELFLARARLRWPDDPELAQLQARDLLNMGRPSAALEILQAPLASAERHYLRSQALLRLRSNPVRHQKIIKELETLLSLDPEYRDLEGVGAVEIQETLKQLKAMQQDAK